MFWLSLPPSVRGWEAGREKKVEGQTRRRGKGRGRGRRRKRRRRGSADYTRRDNR